MCMIDDAEPNLCFHSELRQARKTHVCDECGRDIKAGERYRHESGITFDRAPYRNKACAHCAVAMDWLGENCGGWLWGMVIEDIEDHAREYGRVDLARIAVGARRHWERFKKDGLLPVPKPAPPITYKDLDRNRGA